MIKRRSSDGSTTTPPDAPAAHSNDTPGDAPRITPGDAPRIDVVTERIGHELRKMFDTVVAEPVPEKFRRLLDDLAGKGEAS